MTAVDGPVRVEVDGEVFEVVVRSDGSGHYDFTWMSGPNPGYGFTSKPSGGSAMTPADLEQSIRSFLTQIDPTTGYIE
jgi:hypothetical protein